MEQTHFQSDAIAGISPGVEQAAAAHTTELAPSIPAPLLKLLFYEDILL